MEHIKDIIEREYGNLTKQEQYKKLKNNTKIILEKAKS